MVDDTQRQGGSRYDTRSISRYHSGSASASGRSCFAGTRTPIASVLGVLAGGSSIEEVKHGFLVSDQQIRAALAYAAERLDMPVAPTSDFRGEPSRVTGRDQK
jgi:uncharacterized protein (DUF433 family)